MEKIQKFVKENLFYIIIILIALTIRVTGVFNINIVSGNSMFDTLHNGQIVIGSSIMEIQRGDIVVAKRDDLYTNGDKLVIKRVIGLPGETVTSVSGQIFINGELLNEPYVDAERNIESAEADWKFTVGENQYLILGDNRDNSYDGRFYGPINREFIRQKIYIPTNK